MNYWRIMFLEVIAHAMDYQPGTGVGEADEARPGAPRPYPGGGPLECRRWPESTGGGGVLGHRPAEREPVGQPVPRGRRDRSVGQARPGASPAGGAWGAAALREAIAP